MGKTSQKQAFFLLFFTFFIWSSIYAASKLISDDIPASLLGCLRCICAMAPLCLMSRRHWKTKIRREDWKWFFLVGVLGYFLTILSLQLGIALTGASTAALVNSMTPVAITILAALILKEKVTPRKCLCLCLALAGTLVIAKGASGRGEILGILFVVVSMTSFASASVLMRRLTARYPAILVTTYGMGFGLLFHIPVGLYTAATQPVRITPLGVGVVLYLGFVCAGVAQFTWTKCLSMLPASTCSLFYPLQPVFSAILGYWLLGEQLSPTFFAGFALISLNVVLNTMEMRKNG